MTDQTGETGVPWVAMVGLSDPEALRERCKQAVAMWKAENERLREALEAVRRAAPLNRAIEDIVVAALSGSDERG